MAQRIPLRNLRAFFISLHQETSILPFEDQVVSFLSKRFFKEQRAIDNCIWEKYTDRIAIQMIQVSLDCIHLF